MLKTSVLLLVGAMTLNVAYAQGNVQFTGDFESGEIQPAGTSQDGFFVKTLPNPQGGTDQTVVAQGGAGENSGLDTRVVRSDVVGSEQVQPRRGDYFLRSVIHFEKDYSGFIGNGGKNKPRTSMTIKKDTERFDYDVEGYTGFSIYLPKNLENETGKTGEQGKNMLMNISAPGAAEFFTLNYWVPRESEGGGTDAHWWIRLNHGTTSTDRTDTENIDLGSVVDDKGKWTDFVIRWRANPYAVDTNPFLDGVPNGKNKLYEGNKGILQVWKAQGPVDASGNRRMALVVNKVNTPVGLVPHESWKLGHSFRQYKHGWHQQPTSVKGPVWIGFDEIRFGLVNKNGTLYSDVHPSQLECTDNCPDGTDTSRPQPPAFTSVN